MKDFPVACGPVLAAAGAGPGHPHPRPKDDHEDRVREDEGGDARRESAVPEHAESVPSVLGFNVGHAVSSLISEVRPGAEEQQDAEDKEALPSPTM